MNSNVFVILIAIVLLLCCLGPMMRMRKHGSDSTGKSHAEKGGRDSPSDSRSHM